MKKIIKKENMIIKENPEVLELIKEEKESFTVLVGLPGIGNISCETTENLSILLNLDAVCEIYPFDVDSRSLILPVYNKRSVILGKSPDLLKMELQVKGNSDLLYYVPSTKTKNKKPMLILRGVNSFTTGKAQNCYNLEMLNYLSKFSISELVVLGGLEIQDGSNNNLLAGKEFFAIGNSKEERKLIRRRKLDIKEWIVDSVYGAGALTSLAQIFGIDAMNFLFVSNANNKGRYPIDYLATKTCIRTCLQLFKLKYTKKSLAKHIDYLDSNQEKIDKLMSEAEKKQKKKVQTNTRSKGQEYLYDKTVS